MSDYPIAGYEEVGSLDEPDLSYEFHILGVFRKKDTGELFYATDSGCSCPSPWDNLAPQDLAPIVTQTFDEFERAVMDFPDSLEARRTLIERTRALLA